MSMGNRSWDDKKENYADMYVKTVAVSTAENMVGVDLKGPVVIYSITIAHSQANASGEIALIDASATADVTPVKFRARIASAATTDRQSPAHYDFPRGIFFDTGVIVSAATLTADINVSYYKRY